MIRNKKLVIPINLPSIPELVFSIESTNLRLPIYRHNIMEKLGSNVKIPKTEISLLET